MTTRLSARRAVKGRCQRRVWKEARLVQAGKGCSPTCIRHAVRSIGESPLTVGSHGPTPLFDDVIVVSRLPNLNGAARVAITTALKVGAGKCIEGTDRRILRYPLTGVWIVGIVRGSRDPIGCRSDLCQDKPSDDRCKCGSISHGEDACVIRINLR